MGYTHYYKRTEVKHDTKTWGKFLLDVKKVASRFKLCAPQSIEFITEEVLPQKDIDVVFKKRIDISIGDGMGEGGSPKFDKDKIWFNGVGSDSHETLSIAKVDEDDFNFTKTARKPYDLLVTATLVLYKHHFGSAVEISGDGGSEGFQEGLDLVNETLNLNILMEDVYPSYEEED